MATQESITTRPHDVCRSAHVGMNLMTELLVFSLSQVSKTATSQRIRAQHLQSLKGVRVGVSACVSLVDMFA
eukprot:9696170-Prorocentrum_lima.AAC.1